MLAFVVFLGSQKLCRLCSKQGSYFHLLSLALRGVFLPPPLRRRRLLMAPYILHTFCNIILKTFTENWVSKQAFLFWYWQQQKNPIFFRLFPIISISHFFLTLEKIGIDEKVICYHNISNLLWEKDVFCAWKRKWI